MLSVPLIEFQAEHGCALRSPGRRRRRSGLRTLPGLAPADPPRPRVQEPGEVGGERRRQGQRDGRRRGVQDGAGGPERPEDGQREGGGPVLPRRSERLQAGSAQEPRAAQAVGVLRPAEGGGEGARRGHPDKPAGPGQGGGTHRQPHPGRRKDSNRTRFSHRAGHRPRAGHAGGQRHRRLEALLKFCAYI